MTIEITQPEVEALIQQQIQSGDFANAEEVILQALRSFHPQHSGAELVAAMRASPYKDLDIEPTRDRLSVRDVAF